MKCPTLECPDCGADTTGRSRCRCGALVGHVARRPERPVSRPEVRSNPQRLAEIREFLSRPTPGPSRRWARDLMARQAAGENLLPVQIELARKALESGFGPRERVPGEDDE